MFLKRLYWLLSIGVAIAMLAACAPAAAPTTAPAATTAATTAPQASGNKLKVWIEWGDNPAQLQALFDEYTAKTGVPIEVNAPNETDKIIAALSSSTPPDLIVFSGGDQIKSLARENVVLQLNDIIGTSNIDLNDIFPAAMTYCKEGDKIWCLPWGTDIYALFWNKDLFEEAGLDPEKPPQTMEELADFADKLTKKDDKGGLTQVGFIPDFSWSHTDLYSRMFGGFWYSDDGTKVTLDSQPMIDALKWQQQFYTKYGADNVLKFTSALGDYMSPDQGFYAGKIAMMVDGEWQVGGNFIPKFKPELNYGVAAFPPPRDHPERANTGVVAGSVAIIPTGAKDKVASGKLLAWMMSPDVLAEEMSNNSNLPTSKKAAEDSRFKAIKKFDIFINLMGNKNNTGVITTPISTELNDGYGQVEEKVLHAGEAPEPLLKELQATMEKKLEDALKGK
jgi:multiple sugar transport system substrate-binding protein